VSDEQGCSRRSVLGLLGIASAASLVTVPGAEAKDYASAAEVLGEIDRLEADVAGRLAPLRTVGPAAGRFAESMGADLQRHREERAWVRRRLGLAASTGVPASPSDPALDALRSSQEALVYAHAEGLPALGDPAAVDTLARHMVDLSRHLTVIDLWIEAEGQRG
jgi:hypothetical protein